MKYDPVIELERAAFALAANFVDLLGQAAVSACIKKKCLCLLTVTPNPLDARYSVPGDSKSFE
jgi:hypothetical protein